MTAAPGRPVFLEADRGPIFGFLHEAPPPLASGTGVLLVGPWGWDEVVTYRSRRDWAESLAGRGHVTLRIDLPGSGDSAGSPGDPGQVVAWSDAVRAAIDVLRIRSDIRRIALIGLGLGGLTAMRAIDAGAPVDDLVLWATPPTGRAWLREMRAFAGMQGTRYSLDGAPEPQLLPDGWLEVGGFVMSAETIAQVDGLDPRRWTFRGLRRALLLDRDGLPVDRGLRAHLEEAGVEAAIGPGAGWSAMCADIEKHRPPLDVFATVEMFLAAATGAPAPAGGDAPPPPDRPQRESALVELGAVRETALIVDQPAGRGFGILAEPVRGSSPQVTAVFLNAGAVRRIGPNRMWVDAARRWAARGIPSLRLDIEAIGDADGDPAPFADVNAFYGAHLAGEITAALDLLEARGLGPRFVLIGLCSGAYWSFQVAVRDERVVSAVLLNPRALIWDPHIFTRLAARDARKVLQRDSWGRFMRGQIGPRRLASVARAVAVRLADGVRAVVAARMPFRAAGPGDTVEGLLDRLDRRGTAIVLAFSDEEPLCAYLEDTRLPARFERWPNAAWVRLPGRDHTARPIVAQAAIQRLIDAAVDRQVERTALVPAGAATSAQPARPPSPAS